MDWLAVYLFKSGQVKMNAGAMAMLLGSLFFPTRRNIGGKAIR